MASTSPGARRCGVVVLVDPVPGEVRDADRRHAGGGCRRDRQRRDVGDDEPHLLAPQELALGGDPGVAAGEEGLCRLEGRRNVHAEAAALDRAGVDLSRFQADGVAHAALEEPGRHRRADDQPRLGPSLRQRADHGDLPHGVPEAVAGDVEDDGHTRGGPD